MYKVVEKIWNDVYKVLNTDDGTMELLSTAELVFALGLAKINGCRHTKKGIEVSGRGVAKQEIPIEVWASIESLGVIVSHSRWKYEVSNLGNVRKVKPVKLDDVRGIRVRDNLYKKPIPVKLRKNESGYLYVYITGADKKAHRVSVRLLVASAFIYNPRKSKNVVHINGDKLDCSASNLEWYRDDKNKYKPRRTMNKSTYKSKRSGFKHEVPSQGVAQNNNLIRQYSFTGNLVSEYRIFDNSVDFDWDDVLACCNRSCKVSQGYIWRFSTDDEFYSALQSGSALSNIRKMFISYMGSIRQYTKTQEFVSEYPSISEAASAVGASASGVGDCCRRYNKTSNGFLWRFEADDEFADMPENATAIEEWRKTHSV